MTGFLSRIEHVGTVGSTNDVVHDWLAGGTGEVCVAVADEQTAGRGRSGSAWIAPPGAALLLSLGFRPTWLEPDRAWQLAATASLAMAAAAEVVARLPARTIRLKWPNDLAVELDGATRKVAGVLGETQGLGTDDPRVVVGLGVNVDWPAADFPAELAATMTSLRAISGGHSVDRRPLLAAFLEGLEAGILALQAGRFAASDWTGRQLTTGRTIRLEHPDWSESVRAVGVDVVSGALLVEDPTSAEGRRPVLVGEIGHVRLADPVRATV